MSYDFFSAVFLVRSVDRVPRKDKTHRASYLLGTWFCTDEARVLKCSLVTLIHRELLQSCPDTWEKLLLNVLHYCSTRDISEFASAA
jgi:hypothetical protein